MSDTTSTPGSPSPAPARTDVTRAHRFVNLALNAATALITIAALAMVGIRINQTFFAAAPGAPKPRKNVAWRSVANEGQRIGPSTAPVTVVTFTDFECPFCRKAAKDLQAIRAQFPDRVAIVVRHFPIPGHKFAFAAAKAAECAGRQGVFERYHDLLFDSQKEFGKRTWTEFAERAGIRDAAAFEVCLTDPATAAVVERDHAAGEKHGVSGTPTILVNDLQIMGYPGDGRLAELVQSSLDAIAR